MTKDQAQQQAMEIVDESRDACEGVETLIATAILSAYEEGKREGAERIAELEGALEKVISEVAAWNRDVAAIIGRIPKSGIDLNAARAALEAKSEGTTTESQNHTNNMITILNEPKLQIQASDDGVWLHFAPTECRKQASINLSNYAKEGSGIVGEAILAWCKEFAVRHSDGCTPTQAVLEKGGEK